MDRRKTLATVGAISLTASAALIALGSSMGLFGLTNDTTRVGKLSPIDATQPARTEVKTIIVDDPVPAPAAATDGGTATSGDTGSRSNATGEQRSSGDTRVSSTAPAPATGTAPVVSPAHPGDDTGGTEPAQPEGTSSGSGSTSSPGGHEDD
jgi:hypothetical protein